ncbi:Alpha/Beta hydrolase protein [Suillus clintonianus]|uniref:Alpha/Beta hydrolase protein n=1 Tax=Suillus clintonianus TaxID=1904413 RepID=UPI001B8652F0|nr:Alpha/Beta hydrolase protein [Suillus clintonianus]KAG2152885.1 Alpha/Beta hydrolase protein [Suillus clintonianus]
MSNSASQWGSPTASKRALLIHGMTMCSNSWEGIARLLVAEGFFVVAPNLLGHGYRRCTNYKVSEFAEDLRPYFAMNTSYDVIIGHSFGGPITLSLLPFLPKPKETTVILLDPALELSEERLNSQMNVFLQWTANVRSAEEHMIENPTWSRRDCVLRTLGVAMCDLNTVGVFQRNSPWSFSGMFKNIPPNVKITVLASDPNLLERIPNGVERLTVRVLTGIGHWIQYECPDVIMDAIPLPRAKL